MSLLMTTKRVQQIGAARPLPKGFKRGLTPKPWTVTNAVAKRIGFKLWGGK